MNEQRWRWMARVISRVMVERFPEGCKIPRRFGHAYYSWDKVEEVYVLWPFNLVVKLAMAIDVLWHRLRFWRGPCDKRLYNNVGRIKKMVRQEKRKATIEGVAYGLKYGKYPDSLR